MHGTNPKRRDTTSWVALTEGDVKIGAQCFIANRSTSFVAEKPGTDKSYVSIFDFLVSMERFTFHGPRKMGFTKGVMKIDRTLKLFNVTKFRVAGIEHHSVCLSLQLLWTTTFEVKLESTLFIGESNNNEIFLKFS